MPVYTPGGGGGRARPFDENDNDALSKPYDVGWPVNADALQQINEMFDELYKSMVKRKDEITALQDAPSTASDLLTASISITNAQLDTLAATPIVIVAAPGAGKTLIPVHWSLYLTKAAVGWSVTASFRLRFTGIGTDVAGAMSAALNQGAGVITNAQSGAAWGFVPAGGEDPTNKALQVDFSADAVQGGGGAASAHITLAYYIHTWG